MRLDVGIFCVIDLAEPVNGDLLYLVNDLTSAVISLARITFCVLVCADGAHGFKNMVTHIVLRGNKFQSGSLPVLFVSDQIEYLKILFHILSKISYLPTASAVFSVQSYYKNPIFTIFAGRKCLLMKDRKLLNTELGRIRPEEYASLPESGVVVVLDNVRSAHNVGSAFRSCDSFKVDRLWLCGICATPPSAEIHKSGLGAENSVPWTYSKDTMDAVAILREAGYTIVSVEQTVNSVSMERFRPEFGEGGGRYALVFGNEVEGVRQDVVDASDFSLEIPQFGTKHSLNVSVTIGAVLWHFTLHRLGF